MQVHVLENGLVDNGGIGKTGIEVLAPAVQPMARRFPELAKGGEVHGKGKSLFRRAKHVPRIGLQATIQGDAQVRRILAGEAPQQDRCRCQAVGGIGGGRPEIHPRQAGNQPRARAERQDGGFA